MHTESSRLLLRRYAMVEPVEARLLMAASPYYSFDGSGNNLSDTSLGQRGSHLIRLAGYAYADGFASPSGPSRAGARELSNALIAQAEEVFSARKFSAWIYVWGQFIDHDLGLTPGAGEEDMSIAVPTGDPYFDPFSEGGKTIPFSRVGFDSETGSGPGDPRLQINRVTSYLDGSMIYGSTRSRSNALRTFEGGTLKTSKGKLPPFNVDGLPNDNSGPVPNQQLYLAGDVRANENIELTALHALFIREHNRLAKLFAEKHPDWTDQKLFQKARRIVIAEVQHITYNEYLPALLGDGAIDAYSGYDKDVDPRISAEFSMAAFRMGHTQLGPDVEFFNNDGSEASEELEFRDAFFNPAAVKEHGVEPMYKYLSATHAQEMDLLILDEFRNFLFGPPGSGGLDLAAFDIQRGRDVGLADYNSVRAALGLRELNGFSGISDDPDVVQALKDAYDDIDDVDLFVAGLAEDHLPGSSLGKTFTMILLDQFDRTRAGDRLWYERSLDADDLAVVQQLNLSDILKLNTSITNLQENVFFFDDHSITGQVFIDNDKDGDDDVSEKAAPGITVQLLDADGDFLEETTTDQYGYYEFDELEEGTVHRIRIVTDKELTTAKRKRVSMANAESAGWYGIDFGVATNKPAAAVKGLARFFFA